MIRTKRNHFSYIQSNIVSDVHPELRQLYEMSCMINAKIEQNIRAYLKYRNGQIELPILMMRWLKTNLARYCIHISDRYWK